MSIYVRVYAGAVVEQIETEGAISAMYPPSEGCSCPCPGLL